MDKIRDEQEMKRSEQPPDLSPQEMWQPNSDFYSRENINEARPTHETTRVEGNGVGSGGDVTDARVEFSEFHSEPAPYENFAGEVRFDYDTRHWTADLRPIYHGRGPRGYQKSDNRLYDEVCETLSDDPLVDASDISVEVDGGIVRLNGRVPNPQMILKAEEAIDGIDGISDIENHLSIASDPG